MLEMTEAALVTSKQIAAVRPATRAFAGLCLYLVFGMMAEGSL